MALKRKRAQKARKVQNIIKKQVVPNTIKEQAIVINATSPFQGM
jgi:hypothetical protein